MPTKDSTTTDTVTHSSGPWSFEPVSNEIRRIGELSEDARFWIAGGPLDEVLATVHAPVHGEREEANARLIAAAPEMLAALKIAAQLMEDADFEHGPDESAVQALSEARAAIAKAEGRS